MKNSMKILIKERFKSSFQQLYDNNYFKNKKSFAESLEITPQFLSQLLNDSTPVPLEFIAKYIDAYPVNPGYLFTQNETEIFRHNAPHLINSSIANSNLKFIERPSAMSSKNLKTQDPLSENNATQEQTQNITELAGLLYKMSQTHLEIARVLERMFNKTLQ